MSFHCESTHAHHVTCTNRNDHRTIDDRLGRSYDATCVRERYSLESMTDRCNMKSSIESTFRKHENEKKQAYHQRVLEVEHGSFTPIVLSASGGMGRLASTTYSRLARLIAEKRGITYGQCMDWIRCMLSFSLLHSAIMCLRGSRGETTKCSTQGDVPLIASEARIAH